MGNFIEFSGSLVRGVMEIARGHRISVVEKLRGAERFALPEGLETPGSGSSQQRTDAAVAALLALYDTQAAMDAAFQKRCPGIKEKLTKDDDAQYNPQGEMLTAPKQDSGQDQELVLDRALTRFFAQE